MNESLGGRQVVRVRVRCEQCIIGVRLKKKRVKCTRAAQTSIAPT